ncbi:FMRFamide receptor-like [Haliotis rubra]|uniref:FMRFamide receptor-like n=1 Tax=Haliotis rubra TaxID=36100 RepID=UPI001EE5B4F1|nr:FMRFamide receptor-like [Haliotis rubra]
MDSREGREHRQTTTQQEFSMNISITFPPEHKYTPVDVQQQQVAAANELFHFYTAGLVASVFVVLGIVGNILSVFVLSSKQMRRGSASVCRLLVGLAVYDTVFLFSHGVAGNLPHVLHHMGIQLGSAGAVMFSIFYPLLHISRTGSVYTTVMVTVERCVAVVKPLKAAVVFTQKRTNQILVAIFIFSVIFNIPRCMEHSLKLGSPTISVTKSVFYDTAFYTVYLIYINFIVHFAIPFTLIAVFNVLMIHTLRNVTRGYKKHDKSKAVIELNVNVGNRSSSGTGNKLCGTVLAVTSLFFLCHLVPAVALVLEQTENAKRLGDCSAACSRVSSLGDTLIIVCSATNFILYCMFGRKFRLVFQALFCPCKRRYEERRPSKKTRMLSMKSMTLEETNA